MKFGFNSFLATPDKIGKEYFADWKALGFDYLEPSLEAIDRLSDDAFEELAAAIKASGLPCESAAEPFPVGTVFTASNADLDLVNEITDRAFKKAARLGIKSFVYGGICRLYDQSVPLKKAWDHNLIMLKNMADIAAPLGIRLLVEPVETFVVGNTILESVLMVEAVKHSAVPGLLVDLFHVDYQNELIEKIVQAKDYILEAHISTPKTRAFPTRDDRAVYEPFIEAISKAPRNESIVLEAKTSNLLADSKEAILAMRDWF